MPAPPKRPEAGQRSKSKAKEQSRKEHSKGHTSPSKKLGKKQSKAKQSTAAAQHVWAVFLEFEFARCMHASFWREEEETLPSPKQPVPNRVPAGFRAVHLSELFHDFYREDPEGCPGGTRPCCLQHCRGTRMFPCACRCKAR